MTAALYYLVQSDALAFVALGIPIVLLVVWQHGEAARQTGFKGAPRIDPPTANLARWHWAAVWFVLGTSLFGAAYSICTRPEAGICGDEPTIARTFVALGMFEVLIWAWLASIPFALLYLDRLARHGFAHALVLGFGVILLPQFAGLWTTFWIDGNGGDTTVYLGWAGMIGYLAAIAMPNAKVKVVVWTVSCIALLAVATDMMGPVNPMWLFAVLAFGYAAYRIVWKTSLLEKRHGDREPDGDEPMSLSDANSTENEKPAYLRRLVAFIAVNALLVVVVWLTSRTWSGTNMQVPTAILATVYILIAVLGATLLAWWLRVQFGQQVAKHDAAATFVLALVTASVIHISAAPEVTGWVYGASALAQFWKPTLIAFSCAGAAGIVLTTLTGSMTQIRPFMVALILPAAFILPSESFFDGDRGASTLDWLTRFLEATITMAGLWLMWYGFGPGRASINFNKR